MTDKIVRLSGAGPIIEPDKEIIGELENLLFEAKSAGIKGFGYFLVTGGDENISHWIPGCASEISMISGVSMLWFKLMHKRINHQP